MSIKQESKWIQRERSRMGHRLKELKREYKKTSALKTNKTVLYILLVIWFGASILIVASKGTAIEGEVGIQSVRAQTIERQPVDPCIFNNVECPNERLDGKDTNPIAEADAMLKGTRMAGLGKQIVETAGVKNISWRLVIGLAYAESSLGQSYWFPYDRDNCHNAWGIKPPGGRRADGSYLRCFNDWQAGINSIVGLLSRRYAGQEPEEMCGVYKKPCEQHWIDNINKYYKEN